MNSQRLDFASRHSYKFARPVSIAAFALVLAVPGLARERIDTVAGSLRHPEALMAHFTPAATTEHVHFAVSMQPRNTAGLESYANQVSNPASLLYRQFLTPEQVGEMFGPSQTDVDATVKFLQSNGLTVSGVSANRLVITVDGTVDQVNKTFATSIVYMPRPDSNGLLRTNLTALAAPSSIAGKIVSVDGIDTSVRHQPRATTTTLNPTLFRAAYNASPSYAAGFTGQGVNVAIANWDGYRLNNVPYWTSTYSLPIPSGGSGSNIHVVKVGTGTTYGAGSPQGEGDLDIQAVLMAAPLANVYIYDDTTSDTAAPITTLSKISSDNIADIVSESYGWETSSSNTYFASTYVSAHNLHLSMTTQGITYLAATGDNGTSAFPSRGARYAYPDIDPEVLNVGGSIVTVDSATGARSSEASWGLSGGSGGTGSYDPYDTSAHGFTFNVPPSWMSSKLPTQTSAHPYRLIPDISGSAGGKNGLGGSTSGWALNIFYNTGAGTSYPPGTMVSIDGTSIASPAAAGAIGAMLGRVYTGVTPNSSRSNVRFGRMQDYLYNIGTNTSVFYDIKTGSTIGNLPGTSTAATPTTGWDYATGWGSLNFGGFYSYIVSSGTKP